MQYLYDAYYAENMDVYKSINRPDGTSSVEGNMQLSCCAGALPDFAVITDEMINKRNEMIDTKNELIKKEHQRHIKQELQKGEHITELKRLSIR